MDRSYVVRVNIQKWLTDPRAYSMFQALPFDITVLLTIMMDNWWVIAKEDMAFTYSTIADTFDLYGIDDEIYELHASLGSPITIAESTNAVAPWYDLIVEIVIDLWDQTRDQLYPLYNDAQLIDYAQPAFDGLIGVNTMQVRMVYAPPVTHSVTECTGSVGNLVSAIREEAFRQFAASGYMAANSR